MERFILPKLPFKPKALEPFMSEQQLLLHHGKHHQAYVNGANSIFEKLKKARMENSDIDMKSVLKELSFNIGGHILHSLFWENISPAKNPAKEPSGAIKDIIVDEFRSFERFKKEFSQAAMSVEGSGWAALVLLNEEKDNNNLLIMQIEKHNINIYPECRILMVLDVFEHAYYLDYKNDRAKFIESFWNIVNWDEVNKRLKSL